MYIRCLRFSREQLGSEEAAAAGLGGGGDVGGMSVHSSEEAEDLKWQMDVDDASAADAQRVRDKKYMAKVFFFFPRRWTTVLGVP